jgi:tight adherence protein B
VVTFLIVAIVVWGAAVFLWWMVSKAFKSADADRIKSRLLGTPAKKKDKAAKQGPALIQAEDNTGKLVLRILQKFQLRDRLQTLIDQAGLKWRVGRMIHGSLAMFIGGWAVAWLFIPADFRPYAVLPALLVMFLPLLYVIKKRAARLWRFEEMFPESLEFVARSMRAGHAFSVSLEMIHREFSEPLGGEFRRAFEEHNLGMPLEVALEKLAKRVPLLDVHFFVSAVLLQKRTGGNLAEILDKLAYIIRERFKLRGRIRAISAHGRMTGMALTLIPVGVAALMFMVNPEYVRFFLDDETGNMMLGAAVGLQLIGYGVIKKIISIEV